VLSFSSAFSFAGLGAAATAALLDEVVVVVVVVAAGTAAPDSFFSSRLGVLGLSEPDLLDDDLRLTLGEALAEEDDDFLSSLLEDFFLSSLDLDLELDFLSLEDMMVGCLKQRATVEVETISTSIVLGEPIH
jgi:hypothetical protein